MFGRQWDKGHFVAHSIGGAVDGWELNVFLIAACLSSSFTVTISTPRLTRREANAAVLRERAVSEGPRLAATECYETKVSMGPPQAAGRRSIAD